MLKEILDAHALWVEDHNEGRRADLRYWVISGEDLAGVNLAGANLHDVSLSNTDLSGANLAGADLRGADLRSANLSNANLQQAKLRGARLDGADLRNANLGAVTADAATFDNADLSADARFGEALRFFQQRLTAIGMTVEEAAQLYGDLHNEEERGKPAERYLREESAIAASVRAGSAT